MSREIKELNNAIQRITHSVVVHTPKYSKYGGYDGENDIYTMDIAKALHAEGYRKQSGWISVGEALPKVDTDVLVITANGSFKVARCNIYHNGTLVLWMTNDGLGEKAITHWMPLPEPPKMKGGTK